MKMKLILCTAAAALAIGASVIAPVQSQSLINRITGPSVLDFGGASKVNNDGELNTYSATSVGLVTASSATDVSCLTGSATKTVRLTRVTVSGTAGTLVTLPVQLVKRSSAGTSTGPAASAAAPVAIASQSTQTAATATPTAWTINPTLGTVAGTIYAAVLTVPVTSAGTVIQPWQWAAGGRGGAKGVVLSGIAQQVCVNLTAISISSPVMNVAWEWTEE